MSAVANPESGLDANERIAIVTESTNEVTGSARRAEMVSLTAAVVVHDSAKTAAAYPEVGSTRMVNTIKG